MFASEALKTASPPGEGGRPDGMSDLPAGAAARAELGAKTFMAIQPSNE